MSRKKTILFIFSDIFERIKKTTDIKNIVQLAEIIGVSQPAVSNNKAKNIFPIEWAYLIAEKYNLELTWLLKGVGNDEVKKAPQQKRANALLNEIDNWLEEKAKKEPEIIDWFKYEFFKKFPEFAEWKRKADQDRQDNFIQKSNVA
jgi:transcriptional regulator with XRE-family HTH domain